MKSVKILGSASPMQAHLRLGEPDGSLACEILPRLGEGVLRLGEPGTIVVFPTILYFVQDGFWKSS